MLKYVDVKLMKYLSLSSPYLMATLFSLVAFGAQSLIDKLLTVVFQTAEY